MTKRLKVLLIALLAVCCVACLGLAAACGNGGQNTEYPDYIAPEENDDDTTDGAVKYTVRTASAGGLTLNDIRVSAMKGGEVVRTGISQGGIIEFTLDAGDYDLVIDEGSLPEGYYVPADAQYKITEENPETTISIPSAVISTTALSGTSYSIGDVMYDFKVYDCDGNSLVLSTLLQSKKAVILNFFYKDCNPCKTEFPAIQSAYSDYSDDISIIALDKRDTVNQIFGFRDTLAAEKGIEFTFNFCYDSAGMHTLFGITAWPTTVLIDRYGVIVHINSGSIPSDTTWRGYISKLVADDYTQSLSSSNDGEKEDGSLVPPPEDYEMPASSQISAAIGALPGGGYYEAETNENDAELSWPWMISSDDDGSYLYASNASVNNTYAIFYMREITLEQDDILYIDYNVCTETDDILYIILNGTEEVASIGGDSGGWKSLALYTAGRKTTLELGFVYIKDYADSVEGEIVAIKNVRVQSAADLTEPTDVKRELTYFTSGSSDTAQKYDVYTETVLGSDGYYHVKNSDGSAGEIVLVDLLYGSAWSIIHLGSKTSVNDELITYYNSPFYIDFFNWEANTSDLKIIWNGTDYTSFVIDLFYFQMYSDNQLLPVNEQIKQVLIDFTKEFADRYGVTWYEDQWKEFCYYYQHYGNAHAEGEKCFAEIDPISGMAFFNSLKLEEGVTTVTVEREVDLIAYAGTMLEFVPTETGVYLIQSLAPETSTYDPTATLYDANGNSLDYSTIVYTYDFLSGGYGDNFQMYYYFEAGQTYYLRISVGLSTAGSCDVSVEYIAETVELLVICSDHVQPGIWDASVNEDDTVDYNNTTYAVSVSVTLHTDGYYHAITDDYDIGSLIYVDFIHPSLIYSYTDGSSMSLLGMIQDAKLFDFTSVGGGDFTETMMEYYYKSIEGKSEDDELYGMLAADKALVDLIVYMLSQDDYYTTDAYSSNFWLTLCCYYMTVDSSNSQAYDFE